MPICNHKPLLLDIHSQIKFEENPSKYAQDRERKHSADGQMDGRTDTKTQINMEGITQYSTLSFKWWGIIRGSRNFRQGGPGQSDKKSSDVFFFFGPQLILQKSNGQFQRNLSFFKVPEGVQHFQGGGGVQLFPGGGGSNCLFPIETDVTCDFPGGWGGPDPLSPPWIRPWGIIKRQI